MNRFFRTVISQVLLLSLMLGVPWSSIAWAEPNPPDLPPPEEGDLSWDAESKFVDYVRTHSQEDLDRLDAETYFALKQEALDYRRTQCQLGAFVMAGGVFPAVGAYRFLFRNSGFQAKFLGSGFAGCAIAMEVIGILFVIDGINSSIGIQQTSLADFKQLLTDKNEAYIEETRSLIEKVDSFIQGKPIYLQIPKSLQEHAFLTVQGQQKKALFEIELSSFFEPTAAMGNNSQTPVYVEVTSEFGRKVLRTFVLLPIINAFAHRIPQHDAHISRQFLPVPQSFFSTVPSDGSYVQLTVNTSPNPTTWLLNYNIHLPDVLYQVEHNDELEGDGLFIPLASDTSEFRRAKK